MTHSTRRVLEFLSRAESYPHQPERVTMLQTHASWVFLAPPLVCKIKQPVSLGFLDFSTLELRHADCEREVALNRLLAKDIYLGVECIREHDGKLRFSGDGDVVEWCVMMRQLDPRGFLSHLLADGDVALSDMDRIAEKLHRYHASQPPLSKEEAASAIERLKLATDGNFDVARKWTGRSLSQCCFDAITHYTSEFFKRRRSLLQARIDEGWIRDCHGDLHAEHVHLSPDAVRIYDCIEFNTRFRHIDIANDIAFLAMDLEAHVRPDLARHLLGKFASLMADRGMMPLMDFYKCYRACVRGKVECLHSASETADEAEKADSLAKARHYFQLALRYAIAGSGPFVMVFMGRIASGKSALAAALGEDLGWTVVSSDLLRKQIAGVPAGVRGDAAQLARLYSSEMTRRTYDAMFEEANRSLSEKQGVILDATFSKRGQRDALGEIARGNGFRLVWIEISVSDDVARQRLRTRGQEPGSVSDARLENLEELNAGYEPPEEIADKLMVLSEDSPDGTLQKILLELANRQVAAN